MKSVITTICLLIPLVIFFVIIDRKDFYSGSDVAVQQETVTKKPTTMTTIKAVEMKPVETKSVAETKPVAESKPVETKSIVETKPAETKPVVETKPDTETKPVVETKPDTETKPAEGKPAPAAIPVVTAEEAEKLNAFAIFLSGIRTTVVEGEIVERSELPDPKKSDYPDCRFTAQFSGNSIKSGKPCPQEILLIIEGFLNYNILNTGLLNSGDKVECTIIPFEDLPVESQSTQQADDLNLYLLERFYVVDVHTIKSYENDKYMPKSGIFFSDGNEDYISIFERSINPPIPEQIKESQQKEIEMEIKKMDCLLREFDDIKIEEVNSRFAESWMKEKQNDQVGHNRVVKGDSIYVWRNIDNSFWSLPSNYLLLSKPDNLSTETLDCFSALKKACESNGVQLIVSLVPNMNVISSRIINSEFKSVPDLQTATFVKQLSEIGIESIYASDAIIANFNRYPFAFIIPTDGHPSDTTQDIITDLLANKLERYSFNQELESSSFVEDRITAYPQLGVYPPQCDIGDNQIGLPYSYRRITCNSSGGLNKYNSEIMIIGNSFANLPLGNALASLLQYKIKSPVDSDILESFGPFNEIIFQILSRPDFFFKNKNTLIFQVGSEHLRYINNRNIMLNIADLDLNNLLLNKKNKIASFYSYTLDRRDKSTYAKWGNLLIDYKNIFRFNTNSNSSIISLKLDNIEGFDESKQLVCLIPATCDGFSSCVLVVNNRRKRLGSYTSGNNAKFFNMSFLLPAGTKEITVYAEGTPGSVFAIKDIQIWQ